MMNAADPDASVAPLAAAIGEPARARILYSLLDGRARTSTELAVVAGVTPSTASAHLQRLKTARLVKVLAQGKHRYYALERPDVASALEALSVLAGSRVKPFAPATPEPLRAARTCYDHVAGTLGVRLYDRFVELGWVTRAPDGDDAIAVSLEGSDGFASLGIDLEAVRGERRRFAYACLDWSERRPHLGGAVAAAVLRALRRRGWVSLELDSRVLRVTAAGRRGLRTKLGIDAPR